MSDQRGPSTMAGKVAGVVFLAFIVVFFVVAMSK